MSDLKISVIMPVFNVENYLERVIDSVLNQSFTDFELICIDDGSTDGSWAILKKYKTLCSNMSIVRQNNQGASSARNKGINIAKGKYIMFVDSDDILKENAMNEIYTKMEKANADICYFDAIAFGEDEEAVIAFDGVRQNVYAGVYKGLDLMKKFDFNDIHSVAPWGGAYRREFLKKNNLFFENNIICEDNLFYFKTIIKAERISVINKILYYYRRRFDSVMGKRDLRKEYISYLTIIKEIIKFISIEKLSIENCANMARYLASLYGGAYRRFIELSRNNMLFDIEKSRIGESYESLCNMFWLSETAYMNIRYKAVLDRLCNYSNIYIYGSGVIGRKVARWLSDNGFDRYTFVVTIAKENEYCMGCRVASLREELKDKRIIEKCCFLVSMKSKYWQEISNNLRLLKIDTEKNVFFIM